MNKMNIVAKSNFRRKINKTTHNNIIVLSLKKLSFRSKLNAL